MSDIHALSGAYAVDAVDDIERASFERHLAGCPTCRAEVASLREASAAAGRRRDHRPRPPELRAAVLGGITRVRPLPPVTVGGPVHRRRWFPALVAAVVLALVGVGGAVWQPWRDDASPDAERDRPGPPGPRRPAVHPGRCPAARRPPSSAPPKEHRAVLVTEDMPAPPDGKVYQLWLQTPSEDMVPAGLMPAGGRHRPARGNADDAIGAGLSLEPAGGSEQPTEVVALFDFGRPDDDRQRHGARRGRLRRGRADRGVRRVQRRDVRVTLYEADDRLGGHADTHDVDGPDGVLAIDTGFIVHNERTYPTLLRIFAELGVATQDSEMSMSTRDDATGLEWAGALGAAGLFPTVAQPGPAGVPADAHRDPALPPRRPTPAGRATATTRRCATSSTPTASRRTSPGTSWSPSSPRSGRATRRRAGLPGALPVHLPRPPRHARRLRLARRGRPWSAARGSTSSGSAPGSSDVRLGTPGHAPSSRPPTASRSSTATAAPRRTTRSSSPPIPDQALAHAGRADAGAARGAGGAAVLRQPRPAAHRRRRCCRGPAGRARPGTSAASPTTAARSPSPTT